MYACMPQAYLPTKNRLLENSRLCRCCKSYQWCNYFQYDVCSK